MATRRFMTTPGDQLEGTNLVTEAVGAATAAKSIELTVDLAATIKSGGTQALTKQDVLDGIDRIRDYVVQGIWPPA